jgi:hypothetical protein
MRNGKTFLPAANRLPIVPQADPLLSAEERDRVDRLAEQLVQESPELAIDERLRPLALTSTDGGPTLHLDDLSAISRPKWATTIDYMQDRARLRAFDGDFVATGQPAAPGFARYCTRRLGLGDPTWLVPDAPEVGLAAGCWQDRSVRRRLVSALKRGRLTYIHPHMSNPLVWELAARLQAAGRQPLQVVGPPPAVAQWANDKLAFARTVARLLGPSFVPRTSEAANLATLVCRAQDLGSRYQHLAIKVPDSAGGGGNFVLEGEHIRGRSATAVRRLLKHVLRDVRWDEAEALLVGVWETNVLAAPSSQLWIPPIDSGPPVLEGVFLQQIVGEGGTFAGMRPADFEAPLAGDIAQWSCLLGRLFQRLGYVGRCSFDMVLVGVTPGRARVKFIECNGRWGGTSLPMTLMNRLFGDWSRRPFAVAEYHNEALKEVPFPILLDELEPDLYDHRTGAGEWILFTPARMREAGTVSVLVLADDWDSAAVRADTWPAARIGPLADPPHVAPAAD